MVSIGCRADEGFSSSTYRQLQSQLRDHLTTMLISASTPTFEDIQAITLMAAYSENGFILIALALRFAVQLGIPGAVDQLIARCVDRSRTITHEEQEWYRMSRLWHGVCNLELFFSLDGGKLPGMTRYVDGRRIRCFCSCLNVYARRSDFSHTPRALRGTLGGSKPRYDQLTVKSTRHLSPRKIRTLINHPERTAVDVRLLSQIELNIIRAEAYTKLSDRDPILAQDERRLQTVLDDTIVELSLWLDEWTNIVSSEPSPHERAVALQNLQIQRQWALMTLHLKAIATSGIENIALMTDLQQISVRKAKEAAAAHLQCILQAPSTGDEVQSNTSPYLSSFKWTLDYVWAKCAFSVLLVLKLAILLRDPVPSIMSLLRDAHRLLEELKRVTVGHIAYFQILQTSIEKCEAALGEYVAQQSSGPESASLEAARAAEDEFQGYVPSEFVFEWDFPGLNLKHMPLGWQDLFINIDGLF
jgi:hypothetical protein